MRCLGDQPLGTWWLSWGILFQLGQISGRQPRKGMVFFVIANATGWLDDLIASYIFHISSGSDLTGYMTEQGELLPVVLLGCQELQGCPTIPIQGT